MGKLHISLAAEKIGSIWGLPITNSIGMTWLVMLLLIFLSLIVTGKLSLIPSHLQSIGEIIIEGIYNLFKNVVGEEYIDRFFPLLATIFIFIIIANWAGLIPGVGSIGIKENTPVLENQPSDTHQIVAEIENDQAEEHEKFIPLFRGATADLNTTLAIAIVAVLSIQYYGVKSLGGTYFKKFFNFSSPIMFGVGLLEIVSEFSRIISFAFRLFGNIFAGEVLLTVIAFLMPLFAPLPFLGLELFVGFIQALIFSMLTAVFLNIATISHEGH